MRRVWSLSACLFVASLGCQDATPPTRPRVGAAETLCDGLDNDGDTYVDDGLGDHLLTLFADADRDGFGAAGPGIVHLCVPPGYTEVGGDCDDDDPTVFPGAEERCDLRDDDCDGQVDEGMEERRYILFPDHDADGFGDPDAPVVHYCRAEGWTVVSGDCDDEDAGAFPGAEERCDLRDNDCDGQVDEGLAERRYTLYPDLDHDGYGVGTRTVDHHCLPEGWSQATGDCDDGDPTTHPGAPERCDEVDHDCDSVSDDGVWFLDLDQDGYGSDEIAAVGCGPELMDDILSDRPGDCDPLDPSTYPGATELCDGFDRDCDGVLWEGPSMRWWPDEDGDGLGDSEASSALVCEPPWPSAVTLATDCDDGDPDPASAASLTHVERGWGVEFTEIAHRLDCLESIYEYPFPWSEYIKGNAAHGGVQYRAYRTYDEACRTTYEATDKDDDGQLDVITTWAYDELGRVVISETDMDGDGVPEGRTERAYAEDGELVLKTQLEDTDADGLLGLTYRYECLWSGDGLTRTCEEDRDGDGDGTVQVRLIETYDTEGHLILWQQYSSSGSLSLVRTYTYLDGDLTWEGEAEGSGRLRRQSWSLWDGQHHRTWAGHDTNGDDTLDAQSWSMYDAAGDLIEERLDQDGDGRLEERSTHTHFTDGSVRTTLIEAFGAAGQPTWRTSLAWDQAGVLRYREESHPLSTLSWTTWFDAEGLGERGRLVVRSRGMDVSFPLKDAGGRPGAVTWPWPRGDVYSVSR
ncbi:MAG: putative metal-binding motif-containing protein [Deltaproteobacteria bacterium]|nr:putative metal-binding motif-containing protein [Deltaproteobacteria bacterium]